MNNAIVLKHTKSIDSNKKISRYFINDSLFIQLNYKQNNVESYCIGKYKKIVGQGYWLDYLISYPLFYSIKLPSSSKETIIVSNIKRGYNRYLSHLEASSKDTQTISGMTGATIFKDSLLSCLFCINGRVQNIALPDFYILKTSKKVRNIILISQGYQMELVRNRRENYFVAVIFQDYHIHLEHRGGLLEPTLGQLEYVSNKEFIEILTELSKL